MLSLEDDLVVYPTPAEPEKVSTTMGLRHIKPGISAARAAGTGILHPTKRHPVTGDPLEAVGVVGDEILWPVIGGGEDDDGGDDDGEGGDDEGDEGDDDGDEGDDDEKDPKAKIAALTEEKDRHYRRRKKAEKEAADAKAEIERLKAELAKSGKKPAKKAKPADDADEDDDDTSSSELEAERVARQRDKEAAEAELRKAKIENAFLASREQAKIDWVNPGHVMTLLLADDDYEVEFDDRGNIDRKSLVAELKRFAKANPHLVKPKPAKQSDADGNSGDGDTGSSGSASSMNGQRKGKGKTAQPTREQLAKRFPALGR